MLLALSCLLHELTSLESNAHPHDYGKLSCLLHIVEHVVTYRPVLDRSIITSLMDGSALMLSLLVIAILGRA